MRARLRRARCVSDLTKLGFSGPEANALCILGIAGRTGVWERIGTKPETGARQLAEETRRLVDQTDDAQERARIGAVTEARIKEVLSAKVLSEAKLAKASALERSWPELLVSLVTLLIMAGVVYRIF